MTEEQKKKIRHRITVLTFGVIVLLAVYLVVLAVTKKINTILFPAGAAVFLALYWVTVDVLPIVWLHSFDGKTEEQKRSYYFYAAADAAGLAGLVYFVINMSSMTGALVYVASMFLKKRFHDEYLGVSEEKSETPENAEGTEAVLPEASSSEEDASGEDAKKPEQLQM